MIKNIILQHKLEQEKILSQDYILREKLDFAKKYLDTDLMKVITEEESRQINFFFSSFKG